MLNFQQEVVDYVKSLGFSDVIEKSQDLLPGYAIDIYVPEKNFAIECCDFLNHIESKVGKHFHNELSLKCHEKDIKIFQIFEDEWINQREICESMISYRLLVCKNHIFARKCEVVTMDGHESSTFFGKSHLAGGTRAKIHFGLKYNGEIVAGLSLRKPIQKKKDSHLCDGIIEIARFATLPHHYVSGGFQKLFKVAAKWATEEGFKKILTYADLRVGRGEVYFKNNFHYRGRTSGEAYFYVKTSEGLAPEKYKDLKLGKKYFRFKFRAIKPLTEKQVAAEAGVEKLYSTTNNAFEMSLDNLSKSANVFV